MIKAWRRHPTLLERLPLDVEYPSQVPPPVTIMVEDGNGPGPYGAKGLGEGGLMPVAPAIGNAIDDAVGIRMRELPITPERLWREMRK